MQEKVVPKNLFQEDIYLQSEHLLLMKEETPLEFFHEKIFKKFFFLEFLQKRKQRNH
jgi:hypothetical protein